MFRRWIEQQEKSQKMNWKNFGILYAWKGLIFWFDLIYLKKKHKPLFLPGYIVVFLLLFRYWIFRNQRRSLRSRPSGEHSRKNFILTRSRPMAKTVMKNEEQLKKNSWRFSKLTKYFRRKKIVVSKRIEELDEIKRNLEHFSRFECKSFFFFKSRNFRPRPCVSCKYKLERSFVRDLLNL